MIDRKQADSNRPIALLWPLLRPYHAALAGGVVALFISSGVTIALGWGLKNIVDRGLADGDEHFLNRALLILLVLVCVVAGASYTRLKLVLRVAERMTSDLRQRIYRHLLTLDPAFFEMNRTGDQVSRINADTTVLQLVITNNLPGAIRHGLMLTGGMVMLCVVSPSMTGILLLAVPLVLGPIIYFGRRVRAKSRDTQSRVGEISAYSLEALQGIQTIQSFGYETQSARDFGVLADAAFEAASRYIKARAALTAFVIAMVFGTIGLVLWSGGHKMLHNEISGGDLSAFIFYAAIVANAVISLSETSSDFSRAGGAADRILQLLHTTSGLKTGIVQASLELARGDIWFRDISFTYPTRPGHKALDSLSFNVNAGEVAALVGPSGAGKTTVFQLLQRFYDPSQGSIKIGGLDIAAMPPQNVRQLLGVVAQDPAIFSMTLADNIRIGKPGATDDEVQQAARLAQAHDFITALPQGYETIAGERGTRLSGGQRQRIAIARAILKDPKILLLDEATSALDAANERAVQDAFKTLMKGRTTIIIAHRLSTVQNADRILVLENGRLMAEGRHAELFGRDPLYTHLAQLQLDMNAA